MRTKTVVVLATSLLSGLLISNRVGATPLLLAQPMQAQPIQARPMQAQPIVEAAPVDQMQETRSRTAEQFVDFVADGEFEKARQLLNPALREGWSVAQMRNNWDTLQKVAGAYQQRLDTEWIDENLVLVNLQFLQLSDNMLILFDSQGQIAGVDFPLQLPRL